MSEPTPADQGNTDSASGNEPAVDPAVDPSTVDPAAPADPAADPSANAEPIEYTDFIVPEGIELDSEVLDEFKPFAQELKLDQDGAQKLVDMGSKLATKIHQAGIDNWQKQKDGWAEQSRADKEIGGKDFDANLGVAKAAIEAFGSPELQNILDVSGLGNHPEVVRVFHKIGKAISSDAGIIKGDKAGDGKASLNAMYPTMQKDS